MSSGHRVIKRNFETEISVDKKKLPLNNFVQETLANMMVGFTRTLKGTEETPNSIEIRIKRLEKPREVDAHHYP